MKISTVMQGTNRGFNLMAKKGKARIVDATSEGLAFQFLGVSRPKESQKLDELMNPHGDPVILDEATARQLRCVAADAKYRSCKIEIYSRAVVISTRYSSVAARLKEVFPSSDGWAHFPLTLARKVDSRAEAESIAVAARARLDERPDLDVSDA